MSQHQEEQQSTKKKRKTSSSGSRPIRLNVGGVKYETTILTLRSKPGSVFDRMFEDNGLSPAFVDDEGYFFIDRNGHAFSHILEFLRSHAFPSLAMPIEEAEVLKREADYYGLEELKAWAGKRLRCRHITVEALQNNWMNCGSGTTTINLGRMDGSGLDVEGFFFPRIFAYSTNFQGANLASATILEGYSVFQLANFSGANMQCLRVRGNFIDATFKDAQLRNTCFMSQSCFNNLAGADLEEAMFQGCYFLSSTDFKGANLKGATFRQCFILLGDQYKQAIESQQTLRFHCQSFFPSPSQCGFPVKQLQFSDIEEGMNADEASIIKARPCGKYGR